MKNLLLILAAIAMIAISACSSDDGTGPTTIDGSQIFPLKTGNYWVYNSTEVDNNGGQILSVDTFRVGEFLTFGNDKAYKLLKNGNFSEPYAVPAVNGIYMGYQSGDTLIKVLQYKYPCKQFDYYGIDKLTITVIDTNENVTINLTNRLFKCVHYKSVLDQGNGESTQTDDYLAVGVGLVKFVQTDFDPVYPTGRVVLVRELYFYNVN